MRSSPNRNGTKRHYTTDGRGNLAVCPFCPNCPSYKKVRIVPINAIALFRDRLFCSAEQLEQKFLEMFAIYFADRKATIDTLRYVQKTLTDTDFIDDDIEA